MGLLAFGLLPSLLLKSFLRSVFAPLKVQAGAGVQAGADWKDEALAAGMPLVLLLMVAEPPSWNCHTNEILIGQHGIIT